MPPLVSILIPAYNAERWIAETLRSALAQTWPRKEIIVVDDGSTDRTLAVARGFSGEGVTIVTQANQGASAARNRAFSLCHGDYVQWLDADDLLAPDKIARQMEAQAQCRGQRTLLSSAWGSFYYRSSKAQFVPTKLWASTSPTEWILLKCEHGMFMPPATWLVSRELTEAAGPWDTRLSFDDDGEYFCRVIAASQSILFVPDARMYYRRSGCCSMSHIRQSDGKLESLLLSMQLHLQHMRALEASERVKIACLKYLQWWSTCFCPDRPDLLEQVRQLAEALGGELKTPSPWNKKWAFMQSAIGIRLAKRGQDFVPQLRESLARSWDKALFRLEGKDLIL